MTLKKIKIEQQYPEEYVLAQEIVNRVKRGIIKKTPLSKMITEITQIIVNFENEKE